MARSDFGKKTNPIVLCTFTESGDFSESTGLLSEKSPLFAKDYIPVVRIVRSYRCKDMRSGEGYRRTIYNGLYPKAIAY